jgi:Fe2+ or Zn2+ uptake regulation protein
MSTDESTRSGYVAPLPTAHAICRNCGRIMRVSLPDEDVAGLQAFIDRRPDGWNVEGMSISFTGLCPKCRIGPPL